MEHKEMNSDDKRNEVLNITINVVKAARIVTKTTQNLSEAMKLLESASIRLKDLDDELKKPDIHLVKEEE
jgi:predicted translin family RNA/ssDNA-binding protein